VKDLNSVPQQAALSSLGMDSMMAVEIKQTLQRDFDIFLTAQDIRTLNFAKLIKMSNAETHETAKGNSKSGQDINELDGIKLIVRLIGKNPTPEVLVDLPTKQKNANAKCEIFLLPGLEACAHIFHSLAQKIEAPAICVQYGVSNIGSYTIISEIADCLLQVYIFYPQ
jgi:fatty acid synthase